jgi:TM2 domain-containing membrane protein YozV
MDAMMFERMKTDVPVHLQNKFMILYKNRAKDPMTAFFLCFFLGWLGIHKFYINQSHLGIAYLLLWFACGITIILWIVDWFFIFAQTREYNEMVYQEILIFLGLNPSSV